jgi:hypothetical protein
MQTAQNPTPGSRMIRLQKCDFPTERLTEVSRPERLVEEASLVWMRCSLKNLEAIQGPASERHTVAVLGAAACIGVVEVLSNG